MRLRLRGFFLLLCLHLGGWSAAAADLQAALGGDSRAASDRARDAGRKPADVLRFLGIGENMVVMDLMAAGGYYTEVLSIAVGPGGTVYAQNPPAMLAFRDGANDKALSARLAGDRLANVERLDGDLDSIEVAKGSLDAVLTALNFHDVYNRGGAEAAEAMLRQVAALLKPGGVLGIIDHVGSPDADNASLHRIDERLVRESAERAGFSVEAAGSMLRNPTDDHSQGVFDPALRGQTDRFVLKLVTPTG